MLFGNLANKIAVVWVGLLVMLIIMVLPLTGLDGRYINLLSLVAIWGLAIVGMDLLLGFTGLLSLGQGGFMAIGAYTTAILTVRHGINPLTALLITLVITTIAAVFIGKAVLRLKGYHLAISTLAFSVVVEQLLINMRDFTGGPSGLAGVPDFSVGGIVINSGVPLYYLVFLLLFAVIILLKNLTNCRVGRAWRARAGDELAASTLGVDTDNYKLLSFTISACLAALSGSFYAHYMHFIAPEMVGMTASFNLVVMTKLGGYGTLWGPVVGVLVLILLPDFFAFLQEYQLILNGLILLATMVFFQSGLAGLLMFLYQWLAKRKLCLWIGGKNKNEPSNLIS